MGDRLVSEIRHNGVRIASSYQHWSGGDGKIMQKIINNNIDLYKNIKDVECRAVKILYESLAEYNGNYNNIGVLLGAKDENGDPFLNDKELKFVALHPEFNSDQDKIFRTEGMITINDKKMLDWEGWADNEINFEI